MTIAPRLIAGLCLFFCSLSANAAPLKPLEITGPNGAQRFDVEVVSKEPEMAHGLMGRTYLPENQGMLFVFSPPEHVVMWMKNTLIPLDMLFMNEEGQVLCIHENAVPKSLAKIECEESAIAAVLEIGGGVAKKRGLTRGDYVALTAGK